MSGKAAFVGLAGLLIAAAGCSPGYNLVRQPPPHIRGRSTVVVEKVTFSQTAWDYVNASLSKRGAGDPENVEGWLAIASTPLNNMLMGWLQSCGFQVQPDGSAPADPHVRVQIEVVQFFYGSRGGAALRVLFGSYARGSYPWMRARILMYDGPDPNPIGEAWVHLEYQGGTEGFPKLCGWIGERLGYFVRDYLVIAR